MYQNENYMIFLAYFYIEIPELDSNWHKCVAYRRKYTLSLKKWSKRQLYDVYLEPLKKKKGTSLNPGMFMVKIFAFWQRQKNTHSIFLPCTYTYIHTCKGNTTQEVGWDSNVKTPM